ncbi:MAG: hypothetical protein HY778_06325 [Betaproteobacteria bacterium]|nr:hypothetical protein [Betaproteobacteria bacterium]
MTLPKYAFCKTLSTSRFAPSMNMWCAWSKFTDLSRSGRSVAVDGVCSTLQASLLPARVSAWRSPPSMTTLSPRRPLEGGYVQLAFGKCLGDERGQLRAAINGGVG